MLATNRGFVHGWRKEEANPVRKVMNMEIEGRRPRVRPRKR